jgi:hypothetical protein
MNIKENTIMDEQDLFSRAAAAHARWCRNQGGLPDTPSRELSEVRDGLVILRNVNGEMGCYRLGPAGRLRRVAINGW